MRLKSGTSPLSRLRTRKDTLEPDDEAKAIKQCLLYLSQEAMKLKLRFTAHLIGAAAASLDDKPGNGSA
jgi:hypothetical protein